MDQEKKSFTALGMRAILGTGAIESGNLCRERLSFIIGNLSFSGYGNAFDEYYA